MVGGDFISFIESTELYNILNQAFKYSSLRDPNYLLLLDTRQKHEYNESHILTSKLVSKDLHGAFLVPYEAELESKRYTVVYDGTTDYEHGRETTAFLCAQLMVNMGSRNPVRILRGGYERFSALFPFLRTQKILWLPQELDAIKSYPYEIIPGLLYLGDWWQGNSAHIYKDLKIRGAVNCTIKQAELQPSEGSSSSWPKWMQVAVDDSSAADLTSHLDRVCAFIDASRERKQAVLVFSDLGISRAAAFCLAYLMFHGRHSLQDAFQFLKSCSQSCAPNEGFMNQLEKWNRDYTAASS